MRPQCSGPGDLALFSNSTVPGGLPFGRVGESNTHTHPSSQLVCTEPSIICLSARTKILFPQQMMHLKPGLSAGTHEVLQGRTTFKDPSTLPKGSTHRCLLLRGIRWNPTILLHPDTFLETGFTLCPEPPSWITVPHQTWILTELALLGLGQGLPAPGPLREGERETIKVMLETLQMEPTGQRSGLTSAQKPQRPPDSGVVTGSQPQGWRLTHSFTFYVKLVNYVFIK